jgi:hypothetical protein
MLSYSPSKKRAQLTCLNRKAASLTQPGRGIRKIIDLYHDLTELVEKAKMHADGSRFNTQQTVAVDVIESELGGLTEDELEEEHKE